MCSRANMQNTIWITLANNAALLLALFVIYEISYLLSEKPHTQNFLSGILISAICLAVMSIPDLPPKNCTNFKVSKDDKITKRSGTKQWQGRITQLNRLS